MKRISKALSFVCSDDGSEEVRNPTEASGGSTSSSPKKEIQYGSDSTLLNEKRAPVGIERALDILTQPERPAPEQLPNQGSSSGERNSRTQ
jgi:hypothetical protein